MKGYFRQSMAWLHTWGCLVSGWLLFFVFLMGTATMFHFEISRWMQPERALETPVRSVSRETMLAHALDYLESHAAHEKAWSIYLPHERQRRMQENRAYVSVRWKGTITDLVRLDPQTGAEIPQATLRETRGGRAFLDLHSELHYLDGEIGKRIVAVAGMLAFLGLVTGVIVHKKIFKDFFTFRPSKGQRSWLDAHNVTGVMALPFFLMIIYSGLVYFDIKSLPAPVTALYGSSKVAVKQYYDDLTQRETQFLPVQRPKASILTMMEQTERTLGVGEVGDINISHPANGVLQVELLRAYGSDLPRYPHPERVFRFNAVTGEPIVVPKIGPGISFRHFMLTLHDGWFARPILLWLYVVSGLLGCVMIATGMVLWVVKRREKHARHGDASWGVEMVARLNVAVVAGLPVALAAFFWANRLLPVGMHERAEWELHCLFATWGWLTLYCLWRPEKKAWVEVFGLASAAFGLIPLLNALTTDRHLGVTIPVGDWGLAGFDLSMLAFGLLFGVLAWRLACRPARSVPKPLSPQVGDMVTKREATA